MIGKSTLEKRELQKKDLLKTTLQVVAKSAKPLRANTHPSVSVAKAIAKAAADNKTPLTLIGDKVAITIDGRRRALNDTTSIWIIEAVLTRCKGFGNLPLSEADTKTYSQQLRHTVGKAFYNDKNKAA